MPHEHREADGEGSRAQTSVAPLISHSKDADNKLQGEEDFHGGGHAQTDAWLQLKDERGEERLINTMIQLLYVYILMCLPCHVLDSYCKFKIS